MQDFPHLPLRNILSGTYNFRTFAGRGKSQRSIDNLNNRQAHGKSLNKMLDKATEFKQQIMDWRREQGLPELPNSEVIPVLLEVDPQYFDIESLKGFGFEIISEEGDGFIIGASVDQFKSLKTKIEQFVNDNNQGTALLWRILEDTSWRPEYILTEDLLAKYKMGIKDAESFTVDVSIACYIKRPEYPIRSTTQTENSYERSIQTWKEKVTAIEDQQLDLMFSRQVEVQKFIELGGGDMVDGFVEYEDSFGIRANISGLALKDLLLNYQYVFEIAEHPEMDIEKNISEDLVEEPELTITAPNGNAPKVVVIDSGIRENHLYLSSSIISSRSKNYVPGETTTADEVNDGGHGTKVAGAILYANNIPKTGNHQAPFFLLNARVLDRHKGMSSRIFPPLLMQQISAEYNDVKIFNLSITAKAACRKIHMSQWSAMLDQIAHNEDKMFVISAGNLDGTTGIPVNPGVKEHLAGGRNYPLFLLENSSRIADPAQSAFALTVGSVCPGEYEDLDRISFGKKDEISSFSRSGFGMWNGIKPEIVEYGGDLVREKLGTNLSLLPVTSTEVVKTGLYGIGYDIGTSFAAPKVTHISAHLQKLFPNETSLFYKALVLQSARLPSAIFYNPTIDHIRHFGYGIPNLNRATNNTPHRITFTTSGKISAKQGKVFSVNIPEEIRRQGEQYDILIEVSMSYTAKPRRTRRYLHSYLSSWLTWESSKLGQSLDSFNNYVLKEIEAPSDVEEIQQEDSSTIKWFISNNGQWGKIKGVKRQASPNQKDWAIVKSYELSEELSFAVIGHKGWSTDLTEEIPYCFVVSFEILDGELDIYELMANVNVDVPVEINV